MPVVPAKAETQRTAALLDTGLRRYDGDLVIAAQAAIQGTDALDTGLRRDDEGSAKIRACSLESALA